MNNHSRPLFWIPAAFTLLSVLLLGGCGGKATKKADVEGAIIASSIINPDVSGEYRPVNIKIFFLRNDTAFNQASFAQLYSQSDATLGPDLVYVLGKQVLPGQTIALDESIPQGSKYVAVVAAFRALDQAQWRDIEKLPEKCWSCRGVGLWTPVNVNLERLSVELTLDD